MFVFQVVADDENQCADNMVYDTEKQDCVCIKGYYKNGGACEPCPDFSTTYGIGADSINECLCKPGYGYNTDTEQCEVCAKNTYKTVLGNDACTECNPGCTTEGTQSISCKIKTVKTINFCQNVSNSTCFSWPDFILRQNFNSAINNNTVCPGN